MKKRLTLLLLIGLALNAAAQNEKGFEISKNLEIFANVYKNLHTNYVDDVDPGKTMKVAIDAMLASMDPYTNYFAESDIEDVKMQVMGQYGGIGSLIHQEGNKIYIAEPYEGLPADKAGVKIGDRILAVNGESTEGKNTQAVSAAMRGQAGTPLTLKLERDGKEFDVTLTRGEIKLRLYREKRRAPLYRATDVRRCLQAPQGGARRTPGRRRAVFRAPRSRRRGCSVRSPARGRFPRGSRL